MTAEDIGSLYPTKIPAYTNNADIKAALRLYHYGSESYLESNTDPSLIPTNSIAGKFKSLEDSVASIQQGGIGSEYSSTQPENPQDGYIWVDSSSVGDQKLAYIYQSSTSTWVPLSAGIDFSDNFDWLGINSFNSTVNLKSYSYATHGVNNFLNPSERDSLIPSPQNGTIAFLRQDNSGNVINQIQYYYNAWINIFTDPKVFGNLSLSAATKESFSSDQYFGFSGTTMALKNSSIYFFPVDAVSNGIVNIIGDGTTTLDSLLLVNQTATAVLMITNGSVPYYVTGFQIDGVLMSTKWINGAAPTSGNANSVDMYTITILKTGPALFSVFASMTKFA